jgi:hypothetical protein
MPDFSPIKVLDTVYTGKIIQRATDPHAHIDCPCWVTSTFTQVPCPWHDGHQNFPKGAFEASRKADAHRYRDALTRIRNIKAMIPFDAADAVTECIRIAKEALG